MFFFAKERRDVCGRGVWLGCSVEEGICFRVGGGGVGGVLKT